MRILWVSPTLPAATTGTRARQYHLIAQLSGRHEFTVLSLVQDADVRYVDMLRQHCDEVVSVPLSPRAHLTPRENRTQAWKRSFMDTRPSFLSMYPVCDLRPHLSRLLSSGEFDCVDLELLHTAVLRDQVSCCPVVFADHNVESQVQYRAFVRERRLTRKLQLGIEWLKLSRFEACQLRRMPTIVTVSENDATTVSRMAPKSQVRVVRNGVDNLFFARAESAGRPCRSRVLFVGAMSYGPNVDGAKFFCREVWPQILRRDPGAQLTIAGADPTPEVVELGNQPSVEVTGFVEDIRPQFWQSSACVVPLRIGGGTRLKILEAMAASCPVVSTTIGAEGLDVRDGEHLVLADTPDAFARAVTALLADRDLCARLASNARELVRRRYDWSSIACDLHAVYESVVAR